MQTFRGWCNVRYYEYQDDYVNNPEAHGQRSGHHHRHKQYGQFEEHVEIDKTDGKYERLDVPEFDDCKRATVLHDFEKVSQLLNIINQLDL